MSEPIWIDADALRLLHRETLAEFGGLSGMRDALKDTASHKGLFLSALARPRNLFVYEEVTNISRLAAAYAYGLARNHTCGQALCFSDGNKRAAS